MRVMVRCHPGPLALFLPRLSSLWAGAVRESREAELLRLSRVSGAMTIRCDLARCEGSYRMSSESETSWAAQLWSDSSYTVRSRPRHACKSLSLTGSALRGAKVLQGGLCKRPNVRSVETGGNRIIDKPRREVRHSRQVQGRRTVL